MKVILEAFFLPKAGNSLEEYEDAYCPPGAPSDDVASLRIAVADGATETSFSGLWANLLARGYCERTINPDALEVGLRGCQADWKQSVQDKPLPWYAEQKIADGAFAAIVGLELFHENRNWIAFAVGDCCVFQTREDSILASFPLDAAEQFDNRPLLVSSVAGNNRSVFGAIKTTSGVWESGDTFYLMSDALAAWFLKGVEKTADPIGWLKAISTQELFADFVSRQRADVVDGQPLMRNDDVTLLACTVT